MADILPFQRTSKLISDVDEYLDKVSEAILVFEATLTSYTETRSEAQLEERLVQIRELEARGDELRRDVETVMYTEMLMPDTRGDLLSLLEEVDGVLDECVHLVIALAIERPEVLSNEQDDFKVIIGEVTKAAQAMMDGARAYFKEPHAVRNHIYKIAFHEKEATDIGLRLGRHIFDSDLPLERQRQLFAFLTRIRQIGSRASDAGHRMAIFAVKRSL